MNISRGFQLIYNEKAVYHQWAARIAWTHKVMLSLVFAVITGISAQVRIPLPWTPVPITGQVLIVLMSGVLLGRIYGGLSMVWYILLGMIGIPWFAGGKPGVLLGPTSGYLVGFIPAAIFVGAYARKYKSYLGQMIVMVIAIAIIYLFGAVNFAIFSKAGLKETLIMAVLPFITLDLLKALVAAGISKVILPAKN